MRTGLVAALVVAIGLTSAHAGAQSAAAAEALFQKGHDLFEARRYAEACPMFAESYRLDPVTGALLALASCHEAEGKLASAWAEYVDVASRSQREGRADRADAARQRAAALEPKLARITISLAPEAASIAGLVVKRDGVIVGPATYGTALPVDRGEHVIEASAPGRTTYSQKPTIQDGTRISIAIPALAAQADAAAAPVPRAPADAPPSPDASPSSEGFPFRTVGIVTGITGLVVAGVGGYFGIQAISKNSDSKDAELCGDDNECTPAGEETRRDALSAGNISTTLIVVGGALAAAGVILYVVGGSSNSNAGKARAGLSPAVGRDVAGLSLSGRF